jgi:hypothetical protein
VDISISAILGITAGLLSAIGFILYIRAILKGNTKPERSSWWLWSALMIVALIAQISAGATWSILLTVVFLVCNLIIAILSINRGYGLFKLRDYIAFLVLGLGVILWIKTKNPLVALIVVVVLDLVGNFLTMLKTWRAPYSENLLAWVLTSTAAIFAVISVGNSNISRLIFPFYVVIGNWATVFTIIYRRNWRKQRIQRGRKTIYKRK